MNNNKVGLELLKVCTICNATIYPDGTVSADCAGECDRDLCEDPEFEPLDFNNNPVTDHFSTDFDDEECLTTDEDDYLGEIK